MKTKIIITKVPTAERCRAERLRKKLEKDVKTIIIENVLLLLALTFFSWTTSPVNLFNLTGVPYLTVVLGIIVSYISYLYFKFSKIRNEYLENIKPNKVPIFTLDKSTW